MEAFLPEKLKIYNMKVSVCIPVYNVENLIGRCLESVVNQSYNNLEIIVVNDCTPDNSMQVVNQYAQKDNRIKIISHERNHGLMMARKTGYMAATGDYITFCDSDDALPLDSIRNLVDAAIMSNADIVSGNLEYIDANNTHKRICSVLRYGNKKIPVYKSLLYRELSHNLWSKLYKRTLLQGYEYITYDSFTNGEDACLFYQLVENAKKIEQINQTVYYYYQNLASSTNTYLSEKALRSIVMVNRLRIDICGKYKELEKNLKRYAYLQYKELENSGYNKDGLLDRLYQEYDLSNYTTFCSSWYCLSFKDYLLLLIRRIRKSH